MERCLHLQLRCVTRERDSTGGICVAGAHADQTEHVKMSRCEGPWPSCDASSVDTQHAGLISAAMHNYHNECKGVDTHAPQRNCKNPLWCTNERSSVLKWQVAPISWQEFTRCQCLKSMMYECTNAFIYRFHVFFSSLCTFISLALKHNCLNHIHLKKMG